MSLLKKANMQRIRINKQATAKAGTAAVSVAGGLLDLGLSTGLALVTRSPWAAAAAIGSGALLVHQLLKD